MLVELHVRDLGVIADLTLVFGAGMTALTGETGAGKTLVVEAIELLVGGRADRVLVRPGATEAFVEGRFVDRDGNERVLARVVPADAGRSRAYVDGRMAPVASLSEVGADVVDLHGQHAHQSLLSASVQRAALDAYAGVDLGPLRDARRRVREIDDAIAALGGDARARAREADLLRFQLDEIAAAQLDDPAEDHLLRDEEARLASASEARAAAMAAYETVAGDGGAIDVVGNAVGAIGDLPALASLSARLRAAQADLAETASELRSSADTIEDDPDRLAEVGARRQQLRDLRRKYGETLDDVLGFAQDTKARFDELESHEARVTQLEAERVDASSAVQAAAGTVAQARRRAAPNLAAAIQERLRELALESATVDVRVDGDDPADDVAFLLSANKGEPPLPLTKVASGGELARTMLAARLVLTAGPPTLVFDEVDAGIGGSAAIAVGRSLAALAADHQVLVVTHLPQVAAFADAQVAVQKAEAKGRMTASALALDEAGRVIELSRMLSGQPESATARDHAQEMLASAARERGR